MNKRKRTEGGREGGREGGSGERQEKRRWGRRGEGVLNFSTPKLAKTTATLKLTISAHIIHAL